MDTKRILRLVGVLIACGCLATALSQAAGQHKREHVRTIWMFAETMQSGDLSVRPLSAASGGKVQIAFLSPALAAGRVPGDFSVGVFDVSGRRVAQVAAGSVPAERALITVAWDGKEAGGAAASPGVYFVRATAPSVGFHTARAKSELLVLGHELSQGNFKRFGGSLLVLGASPADLAKAIRIVK